MLSAQTSGFGFWPVDEIVDTAKDVYGYAERAVGWVYDNVGEVLDVIQKYGCTVVNNDIIVGIVAGGTTLVATPAAGGAVAAAAAGGQKGCRYITVSQAVLKQLKQQVPPAPPPPGVVPPMAPALVYQSANMPVRAPNPAQPAAGKYKSGSIARFNTSRQLWSVYSPLSGLGIGVFSGGDCAFGDCSLGDVVDPPTPAGFVKAGEESGANPPAGVAPGGTERDKRPFYKSPVVLVLGGVVLVGGAAAAYMHFRGPRRHLAGPAWRKRKIRRVHQRRQRAR